jgi:RimJ/RimL family protein N-acetyltransferase
MRRDLSDLPEPVVPEGYRLRPLSPADLPRWVELMTRNGELGSWSAERAGPLFAGQMELAASFVVTRGDAAVATAQLNPHRHDEYAPTPELGWVAADPAHRGRGLGRMVAAAASRLVPDDEALFAQCSPGNVASLRALLAAGYRPIAAECLFLRRGD